MKISFVIFCLFFVACSPQGGSNSDPTNTSDAVNYDACEQLPAGGITPQNSCPGDAGTWNNYLIILDSSQNVLSYDLWCGGSNEDHPSNQADYNSIMVPAGNTTNNDYKSSRYCVSGSSVDSSGNKRINIWQKH